MKFCPSLKRDITNGGLMIRQVNRYRVQFALMAPEYISHYVPDFVGTKPVIGHAKVEILSWIDRDANWLAGAPTLPSHKGDSHE